MFAIVSILMTVAFVYASTVPLVFAVPNYRERLIPMLSLGSSESGRAFDWIVNVMAARFRWILLVGHIHQPGRQHLVTRRLAPH